MENKYAVFIKWITPLMLLIAVIVNAIWVSHTVHKTRKTVSELQSLERKRQQLDVEWSQLLLEQSTLGSYAEVERKAVDELGMHVPEIKKVVAIKK